MIDVFIPTVIYFAAANAAANVVSLSLSSHIIASIIVMLLPCLSCGRIYMSSSFPSQLLASFFSTPYTTTRPNASAAAAANSAADVVSLSLSSHIRASIIVMLLPCLSCGWIDMSSSFPSQLLASFFSTAYHHTRQHQCRCCCQFCCWYHIIVLVVIYNSINLCDAIALFVLCIFWLPCQW